MKLIDTHVHLGDASFDADRDAVVERARDAGVESVLAVSETREDAEKNLWLARTYADFVGPCAGLHPEHPDAAQAEELVDWIRAHRSEIVAIGEVGLDHWRVQDEARRAAQRANFRRFIGLALELDLPLNVHSRSAGEKTIAVLLEHGAKRVQLHAFDGRASKALAGVEAGYFFSVPPSVVRSKQKQKLVRRLPLECLLLETDSPVLGPTPGERNEPANVRVSLRAVSELKGLPEQSVAEAVRENAMRLYAHLGGP